MKTEQGMFEAALPSYCSEWYHAKDSNGIYRDPLTREFLNMFRAGKASVSPAQAVFASMLPAAPQHHG